MFGFLFGTKAERLNAAEFKAKYKAKTAVVLDVRTASEYQSGHLKQANNLDWLGGAFKRKATALDKDKTYFLYCASGIRSGKAAAHLVDLGFENVYNVGGYASVKNALR